MPVNSTHADYDKMSPRWKRCRDVAAGGDAVHDAGPLYLPMLKDQANSDYVAYNKRATFYNATWRTISGLLGMIFRKPPAVEVPKSIESLLEDVDAAGQPFQLFLQDVTENGLTVGRVGVLVDYPTAPVRPDGSAITLADAQAANLRPTMQLYPTESIRNWRTGRVANQTILTQVVLEEKVAVADATDEFKDKSETRWRVLDLDMSKSPPAYRQRVYRQKGQAGTTGTTQSAQVQDFEQVGAEIYPTMNNAPLAFIPFIIMGTDDVGMDVDAPPLIDLVDVNLSHFRTSADYAHGTHYSGLPTLFLAGIKQENPSDKIYIGSEAAIVTSNENAKAEFVQVTGGFDALIKKLDREEAQMAVLGARMLEPQKKGVEAADTVSIHRKGEESMLSSVAQAISLGMTEALKWFVQWGGADPAGVKLELNRDFYPQPMTSQMLTALLAGWQAGAFSFETLFNNLQAGEIIAIDADAESEQVKIDDEMKLAAKLQAKLVPEQTIPVPADPNNPNPPPGDKGTQIGG